MARPIRRFMFVLAEKLGMSVARLSREMPSSELTEWMAFLNLDELEKKIQADSMTDNERSEAIKNLVLGAANVR